MARNHIPVVAHFELQQPPARVDAFLNMTATDAGHAVPADVDLQHMRSATVVCVLTVTRVTCDV